MSVDEADKEVTLLLASSGVYPNAVVTSEPEIPTM